MERAEEENKSEKKWSDRDHGMWDSVIRRFEKGNGRVEIKYWQESSKRVKGISIITE